MWTGSRVRLRAIEPDDWQPFQELDLDTDQERQAGGVFLPRSATAYRAWTQDQAERKKSDPELPVRLVIVGLADNAVAGMISTHNESELHGRFGYGIGLGPVFQGRGYASEAMRILFRFMFRERRFHKVEAGVWDYNEASLKLHRRFGFVEEGRRRDAWYLDGGYHDEVHFGLTAAEYDALYPPETAGTNGS